jgi:hypothetical protein
MFFYFPNLNRPWLFAPIFDFRERFERRTDKDFLQSASDNRGDLYSRWRLGGRFSKGDLSGRVVYQYSHDLIWTPQKNASAERSDLIEASVALKLPRATITAGRQRLSFGGQRLLGELNWNNISNAFDAIRVDAGKATIFGAKQGVLPLPSRNLFLAGGLYNDSLGQTVGVLKTDRFNGAQKGRFTLSREGQVALGGSRFEYQVAGQVGHESGAQVRAWAGFARFTQPVAHQVTAFVEGNLASGGRSSSTVNTFDQLNPTAHDRLGLLDTTGWQNILEYALGIRATLPHNQTAKLQFADLSLFDKTDSWYSALGTPNARGASTYTDASGASGRHLGQELDLDYSLKLDRRTSIGAGCGVFWPGTFVQTLQAGTSNRQLWGYLQITVKN